MLRIFKRATESGPPETAAITRSPLASMECSSMVFFTFVSTAMHPGMAGRNRYQQNIVFSSRRYSQAKSGFRESRMFLGVNPFNMAQASGNNHRPRLAEPDRPHRYHLGVSSSPKRSRRG